MAAQLRGELICGDADPDVSDDEGEAGDQDED